MSRRLTLVCALVAWGLTATALAQGGPQTRPPLFLSESWKALPMAPDDHGAWPASQQGVASANLQLTLHGTSAREIQLVAVRGSADLYPLNLWTGTTSSPSAATLRDRNNYVDLTHPLAKIRWTVRTSGFHQVRPVVKLADGPGSSATGPPARQPTSTRPTSRLPTSAGSNSTSTASSPSATGSSVRT